MAVAMQQSANVRAFSSRSIAPQRVVRARPTHMRQGHAANPTQRIWTGSTVQNPLMQPRQLELQQQRGIVCQGLFGLGLPEIAVIAGVTALIFGPSKLPELGKGLGKTVKSFQTAAKEFKTELEQAAAADEEPAAAGKEADKAASKKE